MIVSNFMYCLDTMLELILVTICLSNTGAVVSLESDVFEVEESASYVSICIVLKTPIKRDIEFNLIVLNGSAIGENSFLWWTVFMSVLHRVTLSLCSAEGSDFTSEPFISLTFPDGGLPDDRVYVNISIEDDMILEAEEYFTVSLYTSDPDVKFYIPYARVRIIDNDSKNIVVCLFSECG